MTKVFRKRVFTLPLLLRVSAQALLRLPLLIIALIRPQTSRRLREKVMLACTQVNDCRYCAWAHTHLALKNGIDPATIQALLGACASTAVSDDESIAILYAQHFAERAGNVTKEASTRLGSAFTTTQIREINAYLYAIYFANLSGNTFDALLLRMRGKKAGNSSLITELLTSALSAPVLLSIRWAARNDDKVKLDVL